jgi:hypothetical protein
MITVQLAKPFVFCRLSRFQGRNVAPEGDLDKSDFRLVQNYFVFTTGLPCKEMTMADLVQAHLTGRAETRSTSAG